MRRSNVSRWSKRDGLVATLALGSALLVRPALAQMGGMGPGGGMQPPPPPGQNSEKEEGPAEEAPEENRPSDLEPLASYPEQSRRKMQIFEIDGYIRLRSDFMHDFFLGLGYSNVPSGSSVPGQTFGLPPFPVPLDCPAPAQGSIIDPHSPIPNAGQNCGQKNIGGANLRLRLQPTLNVTDQVRVHAQIDVLDNTILGSTPDSLAGIQGFNVPPAVSTNGQPISPTSLPGVAPTGFQSTTQDPPEIGQNGYTSSIRAKRAWAEIDTEFGSIRFGRMPWHWGRGMFYNDGNCADCDVGTTVDRVMGLTTIYGHQLAVAWDLGAQGMTTQQLSLGRLDPSGYPYDLSQNDDVLQLMGSITRIDNPITLRERIDRGDVVTNYGLQVVYREQGKIGVPPTTNPDPTVTSNYGPQALQPDQLPALADYGAWSLTPDLWFKLYYKSFTLEAEGIGIFGRIQHPGALSVDDKQLTLAQAGWVVASELRLFHDAFFVGFEVGGATGDQAAAPGQYLNYRWRFVQQPSGDHAINDFHFSPDYHVDEIFFRHIMGTVTNATYFKPQAAYWFDLGRTRAVGVNGGAIFSMAQVPVSTPGDALMYGVETNLGLGYRNTAEGFYAGFVWGVFWPLGALDRPSPLWAQDAANASAAQIVRVNLGVKF
ncbi:MAG TPA: TIGR04551 family protein [Polyangia bacterium]|nr:TIGR04551 family protein [Polyangia bacterium]